jgi:hypothetical protein
VVQNSARNPLVLDDRKDSPPAAAGTGKHLQGEDALEEVCPIEPSELPDTGERGLRLWWWRGYHTGAPGMRGSEDAVVASQVDARQRNQPAETLQQRERREDDVSGAVRLRRLEPIDEQPRRFQLAAVALGTPNLVARRRFPDSQTISRRR